MKMNFLVSIIIPVYNSKNTIESVLKSLLNQSYKKFEIILINDGSTDASEQIIREFVCLNKMQNLRYFYQLNKGVSSARNFGLKKALGDYIMFLDSDDFWVKDKIKIQLEIFERNPQIDFLGANRDGLKISSFLGKKFNKVNFISDKLLMYKNFFMTSTVAFKREIISEIGFFDESMSYSEDWEYFLRIAYKYNCYLYNESLVNSVINKPAYGHSGLSSNLWEMEKGELKTFKLGYKLNIVGLFEYCFVLLFSFLKFSRRVIITIIR